MLDGRNPIVLEDVADVVVVVYADDASPTAFYAIPAQPRLALDDQGRPQASLVVYGSKGPAGFIARGGILTLTTALQLTPEETERVRQSLARRLAREHPQPADAPPLVPELRPIEWTRGNVEVKVVPGVAASGSPSLFGGNHFACSANFDASGASAVLDAWERRLPEASITYHLTARGGPGRVTATRTSSFASAAADGATVRTGHVSVQQSSTAGSAPEFTFSGPLFPPDADPAALLTRQVF